MALLGFIPNNDLHYIFSNVDDEGSSENKQSIRGNNFG
jgi:hypothetical protein